MLVWYSRHHVCAYHVYVITRKEEGLGTTLVESSRIYTGQYTFQILLFNDDNILGEYKGREKKCCLRRAFLENPHFVL